MRASYEQTVAEARPSRRRAQTVGLVAGRSWMEHPRQPLPSDDTHAVVALGSPALCRLMAQDTGCGVFARRCGRRRGVRWRNGRTRRPLVSGPQLGQSWIGGVHARGVAMVGPDHVGEVDGKNLKRGLGNLPRFAPRACSGLPPDSS